MRETAAHAGTPHADVGKSSVMAAHSGTAERVTSTTPNRAGAGGQGQAERQEEERGRGAGTSKGGKTGRLATTHNNKRKLTQKVINK